ncbi:MAG: RidA family protein [Streptosporangiaceae bacterium]|nr:RidA family protein [Streptosporangiaceae bacterium]
MTLFDNPLGVPAPPPGRYSHVARIDLAGARLLILSGQIATDEDGKLIGPDDMTAQATAIFEQIGTILAAHGATFEHIVNIRTYLTDMDRISEYAQARRKRLSADALPTSTTVEVSRLAVPGALLEVEVTAVV